VFTGLVESTGTVRALEPGAEGGARMAVEGLPASGVVPGDSIAVNGVCLTATTVEDGGFAADVMPETLRNSSLGGLAAGDAVNLELPLRAGDRMGGHVVQGHVDGTGVVESARREANALVLRVSADPAVVRYLVAKGSVALDGVSLTVAELHDDGFSVSLVPETLDRTTLGAAEPGRRVNIEVDVLAKYVERLVNPIGGRA